MKKIFLLPLNLKNKTEILIQKTKDLNLQNNFIYITSNFCKVQDFKVKFYKYFNNPSIPLTMTLKSLAVKIINEKSNKRLIQDIEKYLILLEILKKGKNKIFFPEEGFAKILLNFIKELKISLGNKVEITEIKKIIESYPWKFEKNKTNIENALSIFEIYHNYLNKKNLIDMEDIYEECSKILEKNEFKNIVFENILEIPKYQRDFVSSLIKNSENTFIFYLNPTSFSPDTQELIIEDTINFLNAIEKWEKEEVKGETFNPELRSFNFPTKEEEIKGIIDLINEEVGNCKDLTLNDFLITCPDILSYRNQIKRVFLRFGIPVEIIPGYSLIKDPSIASIIEFLTFSTTYDWSCLMNILTSPYFTNFDKEKVKKFSEETRVKYENIGFYKEDFYKLNDTNIDKIKKCIELIKEKMKLNDWGNIIKQIIEKTGWIPSEPEIKIEFEKILEKFHGDYHLTKESFTNLIEKILEMVDVEEGKGMGLRVSGIIESLGIEKKVCFVCGTTEKNFPNAPKIEEFFIPEKIKKEIGLEYFEKRIARDRGDFYRIKNEHEKIIFTYPSKIEDEMQMKSIFIFDLPTENKEKEQFYITSKELFDVKFDFEKFKNNFIKNGVLEINVTDLETFLQCPYKFYLSKVEGIKPYIVPEINEAPKIWGDIVHKSFKNTFENKKEVPIQENKIKEYKEMFEYYIVQYINENLKEGKISSILSNILKLRYQEILEKFEEIIKNHVGNCFIAFEEKIKTEGKNFKLIGKADIIEKSNKINEEIFIIDIKTGTSVNLSYTENDFFNKHHIQVPLYVWIYSKQNNKNFGDIKGIIWNFNFLEDKSNIEKIFDFTKTTKRYNYKYLEKIENYLEQISEKIIKGNFSFIPDSECLYYCEYKEMCIYGK